MIQSPRFSPLQTQWTRTTATRKAALDPIWDGGLQRGDKTALTESPEFELSSSQSAVLRLATGADGPLVYGPVAKFGRRFGDLNDFTGVITPRMWFVACSNACSARAIMLGGVVYHAPTICRCQRQSSHKTCNTGVQICNTGGQILCVGSPRDCAVASGGSILRIGSIGGPTPAYGGDVWVADSPRECATASDGRILCGGSIAGSIPAHAGHVLVTDSQVEHTVASGGSIRCVGSIVVSTLAYVGRTLRTRSPRECTAASDGRIQRVGSSFGITPAYIGRIWRAHPPRECTVASDGRVLCSGTIVESSSAYVGQIWRADLPRDCAMVFDGCILGVGASLGTTPAYSGQIWHAHPLFECKVAHDDCVLSEGTIHEFTLFCVGQYQFVSALVEAVTADDRTQRGVKVLANGSLTQGGNTVPEPALGGSDRCQCVSAVLDCTRAAGGWISGDSTIRGSTQAYTGSFPWREGSPVKYVLAPDGHILRRRDVSRPSAALAYGDGFETCSCNDNKDSDNEKTGSSGFRCPCMVSYNGQETVGGLTPRTGVADSARLSVRQVSYSGLTNNPVEGCLGEPYLIDYTTPTAVDTFTAVTDEDTDSVCMDDCGHNTRLEGGGAKCADIDEGESSPNQDGCVNIRYDGLAASHITGGYLSSAYRADDEAMTCGDISIPFDFHSCVCTDGYTSRLGDDGWDMINVRADQYTTTCTVLAGSAYRVGADGNVLVPCVKGATGYAKSSGRAAARALISVMLLSAFVDGPTNGLDAHGLGPEGISDRVYGMWLPVLFGHVDLNDCRWFTCGLFDASNGGGPTDADEVGPQRRKQALTGHPGVLTAVARISDSRAPAANLMFRVQCRFERMATSHGVFPFIMAVAGGTHHNDENVSSPCLDGLICTDLNDRDGCVAQIAYDYGSLSGDAGGVCIQACVSGCGAQCAIEMDENCGMDVDGSLFELVPASKESCLCGYPEPVLVCISGSCVWYRSYGSSHDSMMAFQLKSTDHGSLICLVILESDHYMWLSSNFGGTSNGDRYIGLTETSLQRQNSKALVHEYAWKLDLGTGGCRSVTTTMMFTGHFKVVILAFDLMLRVSMFVAQWTWLDILWMILTRLRVCADFVHVPKSWEGVVSRCTETLLIVPIIWALADISTAAIGLRQVVTGLGTHRFIDNEGESYGTTGASSTIGAIGSSTIGTTGRPATGRPTTGSASSTVTIWPTSGIVRVPVWPASGIVRVPVLYGVSLDLRSALRRIRMCTGKL